MFPLRAALFCMGIFGVSAAHAQMQADTVRSLMSFRAEMDSLEGAPLTADHDITSALSQVPGSFVYDFNAFAWPAAWSIYGLNPGWVHLYFGPIPFNDLLIGRPRYDFLPTALLRYPDINADLFRGGTGVQTEIRTIDTAAPHTQIHYQAGDHKLQRVTALHAQQRSQPFQRPGYFQGLFAYAGASDAGDYPGSRLRRQRQLLLRARYQRYTWSLELLYLHNQRQLGAHSGVLGSEEVRYNRLIAQVVGQDRTRRNIRNDFLSTLRTRILTASVYLSTQSLRYTDIHASSWRIGMSLQRDLISGPHRLGARVDAYRKRIPDSNALPAGDASSLIEIQVRDSLKLRKGYLFAQAGIQNWSGNWSPQVRFRGETDLSQLNPYLELSYSATPRLAPGWGPHLTNTYSGTGRILQANMGIKYRIGRFTAGPYGFISRIQDGLDYWETAIDSITVVKDTYTSIGAGLWLNLATDPNRGVYATLNSGFMQTGRTQYGAERVLPKWSLSGRFGFHTILFKGDLRLDVSIQGRSWSTMSSRTLHAPTGVLVLPSDDRYPVRGSYTIDLVLKGGIRTATVYVLYENMTSGTGLLKGNELVADYPLPAGQLRFGVYWPISN